MKLLIHGARGSFTTNSAPNNFGGHTTCIEIQNGDTPPLIIDAGTGLGEAIRNKHSLFYSSAYIKGDGQANFLVTHTHWDHVIALPTFAPLFVPGNEFHFYSPFEDLEDRFRVLFDKRFFPVPYDTVKPQLHFHTIKEEEEFEIDGYKVTCFEQYHPGTSYRYRVETKSKIIVVATDVEITKEKQDWKSLKGADIAFIDAHYFPEDFKPGFGHSHFQHAIDHAVKAEVAKLLLCHLNPEYSDKQLEIQLQRALKYLKKEHSDSPLIVEMACQGQIIDV
jgi:phosphoribosyl 1,2-cyclic phosphodiesterase